MSTGLYTKNGLDFDSVFTRGDGGQTLNILTDTGQDIGRRFTAGDSKRTYGWRNNGGVDIGRLLGASDLVMQRVSAAHWCGSVGGQNNFSAAFNAGFSKLDSYNSEKDKWMSIANLSEYVGSSVSYSKTHWQAFRIFSAYEDPDIRIDIKYTLIDGGNGTVVMSDIREHSPWHKDFVIAGGGGDKGHYGQANIDITFNAGKYGSFTYHGEWWINSD